MKTTFTQTTDELSAKLNEKWQSGKHSNTVAKISAESHDSYSSAENLSSAWT